MNLHPVETFVQTFPRTAQTSLPQSTQACATYLALTRDTSQSETGVVGRFISPAQRTDLDPFIAPLLPWRYAAFVHPAGNSDGPLRSPSDAEVSRAASTLREALLAAGQGLVDRSELVDLVALGAVAREHVLVIGPPGTAKSEAVRRVAQGIRGRYFEYLLGRFTEPSELFGPVDLRKLRDGVVETQTAGMLPEAEVAFLDEVFLGSTAILNTLLTLLNERVFRRGHTQLACPLAVCVGASNRIPEDDTLAAFADRFLLQVFVDPVPDTHLELLLEAGAQPRKRAEHATLEHVTVLARVAEQVDVAPVRSKLAQGVRRLRREGIHLSDRRVVKLQRLVGAAAAIAGRWEATDADLWPVVFAIPGREQQERGRDALRELLEPSHNPTLIGAAESGSRGPAARATRLVQEGQLLLSERPADPAKDEPWRLQLEGVAREIDASFTAAQRPPELQVLRDQIATLLSQG